MMYARTKIIPASAIVVRAVRRAFPTLDGHYGHFVYFEKTRKVQLYGDSLQNVFRKNLSTYTWAVFTATLQYKEMLLVLSVSALAGI